MDCELPTSNTKRVFCGPYLRLSVSLSQIPPAHSRTMDVASHGLTAVIAVCGHCRLIIAAAFTRITRITADLP